MDSIPDLFCYDMRYAIVSCINQPTLLSALPGVIELIKYTDGILDG